MIKNISNASIQIYSRLGCAPDENGFWEDFKSIRPVTREKAMAELRLTERKWASDCFRLVLEDWNACETEIIKE